MAKILYDEIEKELNRAKEHGYSVKKINLHNSLIEKIRNHYTSEEHCENYYDGEPDYDDDEYNKYLDYMFGYVGKAYTNTDKYEVILRVAKLQDGDIENGKRYAPDATYEECRQAYFNILQQRKDFEDKKLRFNNWQEPHMEGNWGASQKSVDEFGISCLEFIKHLGFSMKDRIYLCEKDNEIQIFFYGRDMIEMDLWLCFKRKPKRNKRRYYGING